MKRPLAAAALLGLGLLGTGSAQAWREEKVVRGTLERHVAITGTVVAEDLFRLKSTVEGRVEAVTGSTFTWTSPDQPLGYLVNTELAAMIDARGSQASDILQERWQKIYKPTVIRCPYECFLLKSFVKTRQPVKANAILFEAARGLKMVGRVPLEHADLIKFGESFTFWPVAEPGNRRDARIAHYTIQRKGPEAGGSFWLEITPERHMMSPGTAWEGTAVPLVKKNLLIVPSAAVLTLGNQAYIPIRVSTGISVEGRTELTGGLPEGTPILVMDDEAETPKSLTAPATARPEPPQKNLPGAEVKPEDDPYAE